MDNVISDNDRVKQNVSTGPEPTAVQGHIKVYGAPSEALKAMTISGASSPVGKKTKRGAWINKTLTFNDLVAAYAAHPEDPHKDGPAFCQGTCVNGERLQMAMDVISNLQVDLDKGDNPYALIQKAIDRNLFMILWTTHSHESTESEFLKDHVIGASNTEPDTAMVREHMRRKGYKEHIIGSAELVREAHTRDGMTLFVKHAPLEKYRALFLYEKPIKITERKLKHADAVTEYKNKYRGFAEGMGVDWDHSCTDLSRLMYTSRHKKGRAFNVWIVYGNPIDYDAIPELTAEDVKRLRADPFEHASKEMVKAAGGGNYTTAGLWQFAGQEGKDFVFEADTFLMDVRPDDVRGTAMGGRGHSHRCPFEQGHSNAGDSEDTGFCAVDASENGEGGWTMLCQHDTCKRAGFDRLNYLDMVCQEVGIQDAEEIVTNERWCVELLPADAKPEPELVAALEDKDKGKGPLTSLRAALIAVKMFEAGDDDAETALKDRIARSPKLKSTDRDKLAQKIKEKTGGKLSSIRDDLKPAKGMRRAEAGQAGVEGAVTESMFEETLQEFQETWHFVGEGESGRYFREEMRDENLESRKEGALKRLYRDRSIWRENRNGFMVCVNPVDAWLDDPRFGDHRHTGLCFKPGKTQEEAEPYYNEWRGWPIKAIAPGDRKGKGWERLQEHVYRYLCNGNEQDYQWLMAWMAHVLQNVGNLSAKLTVSPVIRGIEGAGKSALFDFFRAIFGMRHAIVLSHSDQAVGKFNAPLGLALFAQLEEAFFAGDPRINGPLKHLLTGLVMQFERKGIDPISIPNQTHFAIISNAERPVPIDGWSRRYYAIECSDAKANDPEWWEPIHADMRAPEGLGSMMWDLMHWTPPAALGGWKLLRRFPQTEAGNQMIAAGLSAEERFLLEWAAGCSGQLSPSLRDAEDQPISTKALAEALGEWADENLRDGRERARVRADAFGMGMLLKRMLPDLKQTADHSSTRGKVFPCRPKVLDLLKGHKNGGYGVFLDHLTTSNGG